MMNGLFGKVAQGMAKISMNGDIAIKTSTGYKTYNVETGQLVNVDSFAFDMPEFFFVIPTNKVEKGDIILASGKPRCVIEEKDNAITTFCYEDGTINTLVPERHLFLGKSYFYGKIVSIFGNTKSHKGMKQMMKFMMMSQMMGGKTSSITDILPMILMMNGDGMDLFDSMFVFGDEETNE